MREIDFHIRTLRRKIGQAEAGLHTSDQLEYWKQREKELRAEREAQHRQYLESFRILDELTTQTPRLKPPHWFRWMGAHEFIGPRRTLETQCYVKGHH